MATQSFNYSTPFGKILNFRDVGLTINELTQSRRIKDGLLFRSARPDDATAADRAKLLNVYKIRTIVDLRSRTEHINAAQKYSDATAIAQSAVVPAPEELIAAPLKIPGIRYVEISLNGKSFEQALVWQLSWSSLTKLMVLMTIGYRNEGISILGREVMQPRGLTGLGIDTLHYSGKEIKEIFELMADEQNYPVLIHCTQGKDRTGLIILLLLLLCGITIEAVSKDYIRSEEELQPEMADRLKEIASIGLDDSFAGCPPDFVDTIIEHLNEEFGGVAAYLYSLGVSDSIQKQVMYLLLAAR